MNIVFGMSGQNSSIPHSQVSTQWKLFHPRQQRWGVEGCSVVPVLAVQELPCLPFIFSLSCHLGTDNELFPQSSPSCWPWNPFFNLAGWRPHKLQAWSCFAKHFVEDCRPRDAVSMFPIFPLFSPPHINGFSTLSSPLICLNMAVSLKCHSLYWWKVGFPGGILNSVTGFDVTPFSPFLSLNLLDRFVLGCMCVVGGG